MLTQHRRQDVGTKYRTFTLEISRCRVGTAHQPCHLHVVGEPAYKMLRHDVGCALRTKPWLIEANGAQGAPYEE